MNTNLSIIVAIAKNNAIGQKGGLLCHLPADLKHFKNVTSGHTVIMGRRTFESLPKGALPNRRNIVVTRNLSYTAERIETAFSLEDALDMVKGEPEAFIIGGAQIYQEALPLASRLYLTWIDAEFPDADTFFPEPDLYEWKETNRETFAPDEKNPYPYTFQNLIRKAL